MVNGKHRHQFSLFLGFLFYISRLYVILFTFLPIYLLTFLFYSSFYIFLLLFLCFRSHFDPLSYLYSYICFHSSIEPIKLPLHFLQFLSSEPSNCLTLPYLCWIYLNLECSDQSSFTCGLLSYRVLHMHVFVFHVRLITLKLSQKVCLGIFMPTLCWHLIFSH